MSNYTKNQYVDDPNNSWSMTFNLVKEKSKVLDIGCSSGNFGAELIEHKQCVVDGIDIDENDVTLARQKLRNAYVINVETDSLDSLKEKYDFILMLDVIEHLVNPTAALKKIASLLKPNGKLIFSVPNMAHISVRLDLLLGDLDYRNVGLLDDTHLHFYSEKTLLRVLNDAGYAVTKSMSTTISYPQQLINLKLKEAGLTAKPEFKEMISESKGNVYQFVGVAQPTKTKPVKNSFPAQNPHEIHYKQVEDAMTGQTEEIKQLQNQLRASQQVIDTLNARFDRITSSLPYKIARASSKPLRKVKSSISHRAKRG